MKKFNARVKVGTKVQVIGFGWHTVKAIHETRKWIEINGLEGSFQVGNISKYTNSWNTDEQNGEKKMMDSFEGKI